MSTERLFVGQSFTPQLRGVNLVPPATPSWSTGTDAEIIELLAKHYAGEINLHDIWNIGDTRTVRLSAMPATGVGESHVEQDVEFQLVNAGGKYLADGTECAFIVQQKGTLGKNNANNSYDMFVERGYMNPASAADSNIGSNVGGWKDCARRAWCNSVYRNAVPSSIRDIFKLHVNKTSQGNKLTTFDETEDYFALPAEYNVFGRTSKSVSGEDTVYWTYYQTSENRIKRVSSSNILDLWWIRSPVARVTSAFCAVDTKGEGDYVNGNSHYTYGIAPFGCI